MYITCLTKTSYIELQHPLDIILLEESCEASTPSMLLPSCTTLSKEISQTKLGFQQEQLKLNYTDIKDFTAIKYMPLKKLTEDQLNKWVQEIPDIKDITLGKLNITLLDISNEYPWQMPTWLKIFLSITITILVIGIIISSYLCRVREIYVEEHLLNWCPRKNNVKLLSMTN